MVERQNLLFYASLLKTSSFFLLFIVIHIDHLIGLRRIFTTKYKKKEKKFASQLRAAN